MKSEASEWLNFASKDFLAAKKLCEDDQLTGIVLFHCQQTIEKSLKALLAEQWNSIPKIHSVYTLFEKLPTVIKNKIDIKINDLELVDTIYIDTRYPSDIGLLPSGLPTKKEVAYILELTETIYNSVLEFLN